MNPPLMSVEADSAQAPPYIACPAWPVRCSKPRLNKLRHSCRQLVFDRESWTAVNHSGAGGPRELDLGALTALTRLEFLNYWCKGHNSYEPETLGAAMLPCRLMQTPWPGLDRNAGYQYHTLRPCVS